MNSLPITRRTLWHSQVSLNPKDHNSQVKDLTDRSSLSNPIHKDHNANRSFFLKNAPLSSIEERAFYFPQLPNNRRLA